MDLDTVESGSVATLEHDGSSFLVADSNYQLDSADDQGSTALGHRKHQGEYVSGKDYYEILGIRPSASQDEIDLAYRGRRSQYHPDRYANADDETLAWATNKMKEVNEAYRVLNEPQARAQFDQRKASASSGSRPPPYPGAKTRPSPAGRASAEPNRSHVGPDAARLLAIHRRALGALQSELEDEALLIDELIDRQMLCIAEHFSEWKDAVERFPKRSREPVDAEVVKVSLVFFMALHYYGLSGLPESFKESLGEDFIRLYVVGEVYKDKFINIFSQTYGQASEFDEDYLRIMLLMFFHSDGATEGFDLKMPRKDLLISALTKAGGLSEAGSQGLIRQFEDHTWAWVEAICEADEDEDEDEGNQPNYAQAGRFTQAESMRSQPPPVPRVTLREALQGVRFHAEPLERVFVAPNIPLKKLNGALDSYGDGLHPKEIIALVDDTVFGGARDGVLITEKEIRAKAAFEPFDTRSWTDVSEIVAEGKYVYIDGRSFAELNMPDKRDIKQLFQAVNKYVQCNFHKGRGR